MNSTMVTLHGLKMLQRFTEAGPMTSWLHRNPHPVESQKRTERSCNSRFYTMGFN